MSGGVMLPKECRAVRMASMVRPTAVRAHQMRSASSFRGETIVSARRLENRPQRAATVVLAAYNADSGRDGYQQEGLQERVVQVRRVTKVVKGGKQLSFRAVVVVGNENGMVGVGCDSAKEVLQAVRKAAADAKRNLVSIPLTKNASFPHRFDGIFGSAKVMLRPAAEGTGVIAGGAVRVVLELAGVKNGFGKQLGSSNPLNNAKATVEGLKSMRTFEQVAAERGVPIEKLLPIEA